MAPPPSRRILIPICVALCAAISAAAWRPLPRSTALGGCGPTSLHALCRGFGFNVSVDRVFGLFAGDEVLSTFAEIQTAAQQLGLEARGLEMTLDELKQERPRGILHLDDSHFVAVLGYDDSGPRIADPIERGQTRIAIWSYAELATRWDGRILVISRALPAGRQQNAASKTKASMARR